MPWRQKAHGGPKDEEQDDKKKSKQKGDDGSEEDEATKFSAADLSHDADRPATTGAKQAKPAPAVPKTKAKAKVQSAPKPWSDTVTPTKGKQRQGS